MPDNTLSTLAQIRILVRQLTRSPSASQITDADIDNYVNTFVLYDFPEHLRMFYLRKTLTFYSTPYVDTYTTNTTTATDPLYNFKNLYITTHGPILIGGVPAYFTQSREQFFGIYPMVNNITSIGTGDGVTTYFTGVATAAPILSGNITISSIDINNNGLVVTDTATDPQNGEFYTPDEAHTPATIRGIINYPSGTYAFRFPIAPKLGADISLMTIPYVLARPAGVLFYDGTFTLRPVPDKCYPINLEVYKRPTEFLAAGQMPELSEWWQYIGYGAAKKVLERRMDPDTVQIIMPEFKKQEALILRRSLVQQSNERTATIYTEQSSIGSIGNGLGWGGGNF
jgi:hypothetical protein